jgi:hypothetical protein
MRITCSPRLPAPCRNKWEQCGAGAACKNPALKSVRENSVVPPGLESFLPLFPALKRWAKLVRPSGAGFPANPFHLVGRKRVLTHTLKTTMGRVHSSRASSSRVHSNRANSSRANSSRVHSSRANTRRQRARAPAPHVLSPASALPRELAPHILHCRLARC